MLTSQPHNHEEAWLDHEEARHKHENEAIEGCLLTSHLTIMRELPWLVKKAANTQKCFQQYGFCALNMYSISHNTCN